MLPSPSTKKRLPGHLPTPQDLEKIFKKPRHDHPEILETYVPLRFPDMPPVPPLSSNMPPITHSVPHNAVPILTPPYRVSDFFSDHKTKLNAEAKKQFNESVACYPPPKAPFMPREETGARPGVMVPFVFPPLPSIQYDPLTNMPEEDSSDEEQEDYPLHDRRLTYPVMAPLPFPPPNYMPYPLISEKAPPTPREVFGQWLDALEKLPRVDMVVASAAGSIFDLYAEAGATGLTATKLQEMVRLGQVAESDPEAYDDKSDSSDSLDVLESSYRDFMDYFENIDTSNEYDPHATKPLENVVVVDSTLKNKYIDFNLPDVESGKVLRAEPTSIPLAFEPAGENFTEDADSSSQLPDPPLLGSESEVTNANGARKEHRREILAENLNRLETHFQENRERIYVLRKRQLLERLQQLQSSEVHFDRSRDKIYNEDLQRYACQRQAENDERLLGLKLSQNYEKLKTVLNFYQTSSRLYKTMNLVMINKLQKMKNFFEYQKLLLDDHSFVKGSNDPDAISIRNRDISKLYEGFVDQDYSNEIKEVFRAAVANDDDTDKEDPYTLDPSLFRKVYVGHKHTANVHDFMPLVTKEEFRLVTGEAPSKLGPAKDPNSKGKGGRHQIFQSSLYDRVTSGSDTNGSDSGMTVKRRPGRRAAPKPTYGEEVAKNNNDAALVAKIMKQFIGPGAANAQELTEDLDLIGIQTKWPVK